MMSGEIARRALLAALASKDRKESALSSQSRLQTVSILRSQPDPTPERSLDLLTKVVRPLFSTTKHVALTATGRKNLVPPPLSAGRFNNGFYDELDKPWKNDWMVPLLKYVLLSYGEITGPERKDTLEAQFHLLIPPILNTIDDADIEYKTRGCRLLKLLCEEISSTRSDVLKRTGLSDVFVGALQTNFMLLPTLTPEDESLALLGELYPAFRALIVARFPDPHNGVSSTITSTAPSQGRHKSAPVITVPSSSSSAPSVRTTISNDNLARQSLLDVLMRKGILASYAHSSENIKVSTFLLKQASDIVSDMGIRSAKYLQQLLPLLRNVLSNPFGISSPELLLSAIHLMKTLVEVCWPRIQEAWWGECLRGCVGCWLVLCEDEAAGSKERAGDVKTELQQLVALLNGVVGADFSAAQARLVNEEDGLTQLFVAIPSLI